MNADDGRPVGGIDEFKRVIVESLWNSKELSG